MAASHEPSQLTDKTTKGPRSANSTGAYRVFCLINAYQKNKFSNEEVDTKVLVDGIAVTLQTSEETEGEDANCQADQGDDDAHPGDDGQQQFVNAIFIHNFPVGHENSKIGQVAACTRRATFISVNQLAALGRPISHHGSL